MIRKDEKGHIAVETLGAFIPFLLVMISILSLVQLVATQARVHNALTQSALTISMYSYTMVLYDEGADQGVLDILANGLLSLSRERGPRTPPFSSPSAAANQLRNTNPDTIVRSLVGRFLENDGISGHQHLLDLNVVSGLNGLDFTGSQLLDSNGDVKLTVTYKVAYTFGNIPMPLPNPYLEVTQTVKTKAWLGGSMEGYDFIEEETSATDPWWWVPAWIKRLFPSLFR